MLTQEANDRYTRVGPGTPMGELMRRYLAPHRRRFADERQVDDEGTPPGRGSHPVQGPASGTFGLMEPHCAHRRMNMIYGIPEEHGLRCPYHGWLYDETGQCIEQPYEETEDPEARFKDKIKMKAYPVEVKAGLVFAYMGPTPEPLVPNWDVFSAIPMTSSVTSAYAELSCNWLQCQENSLDPVHLEWLHGYVVELRFERCGTRPMRQRTIRAATHKVIALRREYEYGIIQAACDGREARRRTRRMEVMGHPIIFPYYLRQGGDGFNIDRTKRTGEASPWARRCRFGCR